jgi:hypothetical protein
MIRCSLLVARISQVLSKPRVIAKDEILKQSAKRREVAATVAISLTLQSLFRAKRRISYRNDSGIRALVNTYE